ncbi:endogenous retrovirus group K member 104 Pro protein-like [Motacilla alba alba]|uniref:endogenous retrovirus group K member 104 Pro protein-like n=1 Tax=Motacilla alba alba TaxID=1094192 RepID=UPI0018D4F4E1|nr:endogenous retrovirus group K member 104 Pro protein-like [Motacilla alba alba]
MLQGAQGQVVLSWLPVRTADRSRGAGNFGSTGSPQVHWTTILTKDRPKILCTLFISATPSEIRLRGLLDSRADVMVLSLAAWPPEWPLNPVETPVAGLGGTAQCYVSQCQNSECPSDILGCSRPRSEASETLACSRKPLWLRI